MQSVLIQQKCGKALKGEAVLPVTMSQVEKIEMVDMAMSAIVLCLGDKVLIDVAKETTTTIVWVKLESLYLTKSLARTQLVKQKLFSIRIMQSKTNMKQLTKFSKILDDLENIEEHLEDEDNVVLLLCDILSEVNKIVTRKGGFEL